MMLSSDTSPGKIVMTCTQGSSKKEKVSNKFDEISMLHVLFLSSMPTLKPQRPTFLIAQSQMGSNLQLQIKIFLSASTYNTKNRENVYTPICTKAATDPAEEIHGYVNVGNSQSQIRSPSGTLCKNPITPATRA